MKIFVAYGYNDRDKWIKEMIFPIIRAFGADVETGEETYSGSISEVVKRKIQYSDALIAFTTRREPQNATSVTTHQWVKDELAIAVAHNKKIVEVRETGVDPQSGITSGYQRIEYDENARDKCLVEIVKAVGVWQSANLVRVQLLPEVIRTDLRLLLRDEGLVCKYRIRSGGFTDDYVETKIEKISNGLFIHIPQPKSDELVQISVKHGSRVWESSYESLNSYGISLEEV
ncbi:hypothetical protein BH20ACI4_BH20ACI4_03550 [soil metagenome]